MARWQVKESPFDGSIGLDAIAAPVGKVELLVNAEHLQRVVRQGILQAKVSIDIATADFKAMLIPDPAKGSRNDADSIVQVLRRLANTGVETRLLHAGVPSGAALKQLRRGIPENLIIRRCPRLHAKAVIIDSAMMYLGSANLTGAGLGAKSDGRRNIEWGVWTESLELIDAVLQQFNNLWEGQCCETCQRRDICPEPLEEPNL